MVVSIGGDDENNDSNTNNEKDVNATNYTRGDLDMQTKKKRKRRKKTATTTSVPIIT